MGVRSSNTCYHIFNEMSKLNEVLIIKSSHKQLIIYTVNTNNLTQKQKSSRWDNQMICVVWKELTEVIFLWTTRTAMGHTWWIWRIWSKCDGGPLSDVFSCSPKEKRGLFFFVAQHNPMQWGREILIPWNPCQESTAFKTFSHFTMWDSTRTNSWSSSCLYCCERAWLTALWAI